ncbi:hypothetical protein GCM10009716_23500 [Streptomyces sodiiphilus]|uniref:DoxX family protein n=1 Tax=Streptomyces sodiiphilus TaxID=226217 RepID=A0ABP5AG38_9ACTN
MNIAYIVVAAVLSLLLVVSGRGKLVKDKHITETLTKLDVPMSWFAPLALLEFAGALGLLAGIFYRPLGIAAGIGVVLYFAGAVITHLRAGDAKGTTVPAVLLVAGAVPAVLGLATV